MKHIVLISIFITSIFSVNAKTVTGVYECTGDVSKREFKLTISKNGDYEENIRSYFKDNIIKVDVDTGKNYNTDMKVIYIGSDKRERVIKKDGVVMRLQSFDYNKSITGHKSFPALKKGLKVNGKVVRSVEEKLSKKKYTQDIKFTVNVMGSESVKHPTLGKLKVWNTEQTYTYKVDGVEAKWNIKGKYNSKYGYIEFTEVDFFDGKKDYLESCRLANWKES